METDVNYSNEPKFKYFVIAIEKSLKNFEYSSEWADLISCLAKLNKTIQAYPNFPVIPRKLLVGKRLAQCLHPALPSGVHLKALDTFGLIFNQIGASGLAEDLFIYGTGLFPLFGHAAMPVKPVLLSIYETFFLPLRKKLIPCLQGFIMGLLPGIEEVSEHTERTCKLLEDICYASDPPSFFSALWNCALFSSTARLPSMMFGLEFLNKKTRKIDTISFMGNDCSLLVNAICSGLDDQNVLAQRTTLDFLLAVFPLHSNELGKSQLIFIMQYAISVVLRRDMSLNRRFYQWVLHVNNEGIPKPIPNDSDKNITTTTTSEKYFEKYSRLVVVMAMAKLFKDASVAVVNIRKSHTNVKVRSDALKPFRILISLLDKPEVGSVILEDILIELFRCLYTRCNQTTRQSNVTGKDCDEIIKTANLLFNAFEPSFIWNYLERLLFMDYHSTKTSSVEENDSESSKSQLISVLWQQEEKTDFKKPSYLEIFQIIGFLLDIVALEATVEVQSDHWPLLLNGIIEFLTLQIDALSLVEIKAGISLLSNLLSKLSPAVRPAFSRSSSRTFETMKSTDGPPLSPKSDQTMILPSNETWCDDYEDTNTVPAVKESSPLTQCIEGSKLLFVEFIEQRVFAVLNKAYASDSQPLACYTTFRKGTGFNGMMEAIVKQKMDATCSTTSSDGHSKHTGSDDYTTCAETFGLFCKYLLELSCFPIGNHINFANETSGQGTNGMSHFPSWLQSLLLCCCQFYDFDIRTCAIRTLLDLLNVSLSVFSHSSKMVQQETQSNIVPLISVDSLRQIEDAPIYQMLAKNLWESIHIDNCQQHKTCVDLFLQLHNLTPTPSLCENVISLSLAHHDADASKMAHWRFSVLWHLSREFYKNDSNRCQGQRVLRTLDSCMLLCMDSLESLHPSIRMVAKNWLLHSNHFGDIGRLLEPLLLILLKPSSARVSVHYADYWLENSMLSHGDITSERKPLSSELSEDGIESFDDELDGQRQKENDKQDGKRLLSSSSSDVLNDNIDVEYRGMKPNADNDNQQSEPEVEDTNDEQDIDNLGVESPTPVSANQNLKQNGHGHPNRIMRKQTPHPLIVHKLYYTQPYDTEQVLYSLKTLRNMLTVNGRAFLCSATTASMSMCNTPHQHALRELLIRHRRALTAKEFYGSLADSHQLLVRASTAKYIEVLISVSLHYIRSDYHTVLRVNQDDVDGNFAVIISTVELLTSIVWEVLDLANDNGSGFGSFVADLFRRCKVQRIALHCLLSTVYTVEGCVGDDIDFNQLTINSSLKNRSDQIRFDIQKALLSLVRSLIALEHCVGVVDIDHDTVEPQIKNKPRFKKNLKTSSSDKTIQWDYVINELLAAQPMLIAVCLSALKENTWMRLHHDWNSLIISSLASLGNALPKLIVPVVEQLSLNLRTISDLYGSTTKQSINDSVEDIPVDHLLTMLEDVTSMAHFCLVDTSSSAAIMTPKPRSKGKQQNADDSASSTSSLQIFSNLVHVFSTQGAPLKQQTTEEVDKPLIDARESLLSALPGVLFSLVQVWTVWHKVEAKSITNSAKSSLPFPSLEIGVSKDVNQSVLQLLTPIAMNHTIIFLAASADVWCQTKAKETAIHGKNNASVNQSTKDWLTVMNRKTTPSVTEEQLSLLNIITSVKALSLESLVDTTRQILKHGVTSVNGMTNPNEKSTAARQTLEVNLLQLICELIQRADLDKVIQVRLALLSLFRDGLTLNLVPPAQFVLMAIMSLFIQRVPVPDERRARKELQDLAQKLIDFCNSVAGASLESSAWFRRNLTVVNKDLAKDEIDNPWQVDDPKTEEPVPVEAPPISPLASNAPVKNSQFSVQALCTLAEMLAPMLDLLYLSEEKDKVAPLLVYVMYNVVPYLKNHSPQNINSFRAASAMLAAITDYQYTLRAWKKDVYDLFLEPDFFGMDVCCLESWRVIIDRLMTFEAPLFKDLITRVSVSQSGSINLFSNKEQELEQRSQLLRRLSFVLFCGEVDQYHSHLPEIQERLAECVRQLQAPCLHEQVFLCFRVLMLRMTPNHLISLWPSIITELVHVLLHLEQDLKVNGRGDKKAVPLANLESYVGVSSYHYKRSKWLKLYISALKLLDLAISLPSELMPQFQIYRWSFFDLTGVDLVMANELQIAGGNDSQTKESEHDLADGERRWRLNRGSSSGKSNTQVNGNVTKPSNSKAGTAKNKSSNKNSRWGKSNTGSQSITADQQQQKDVMRNTFMPYLCRISQLIHDLLPASKREPKTNLLPHKIQTLLDLYPYLSSKTGLGSAQLSDILVIKGFNLDDAEIQIAKEFIDMP